MLPTNLFSSLIVVATLTSTIFHARCQSPTASSPKINDVYASADAIRPLMIGSRVPELSLKSVTGAALNVNRIVAEKPTVIVFYRGGWCRYCNLQLQALQQIESEMIALGYQIIAVSPDKPEKLRESIGNHGLHYTLASDSKMVVARAFGIAFQLDDQTLEKYKGYGIDLDDATGESHHWLPVPSVFIVDTKGVIKFSYADPDYKKRLDPSVLLAAAKAAVN